jgi:myo-inositol 2-dehydrogenase/D-chiro-inositol 1-dehydrogenase
MLRVGLIGYGAWGAHHARVIASTPNVALTALAAKSEATLNKARTEHPDCKGFADYRELLRQELDAVVVVLPSHLHYEVSQAVLESGRHLLLEKPMTLSIAHCDELIALAKTKKRVLAIGHEMRLSSLWGKVHDLLQAGAIGEPLYLLIELWRRPYRLGADGWRYDIDRVGNWILEEPIHFFDLARWYLNANPLSVFARSNGKRLDHPELHDHFSAIVDFPGGRYAVISQCLGGWEHHQTVKISGRDGALWASWSGANDRTFKPTYSLRLQKGDVLEEAAIAAPAGEVFELETQFARFVDAIQTGVAPPATGEDGRWAVAMCLKAAESARRGMPMTL